MLNDQSILDENGSSSYYATMGMSAIGLGTILGGLSLEVLLDAFRALPAKSPDAAVVACALPVSVIVIFLGAGAVYTGYIKYTTKRTLAHSHK